MAWPGAGLRPGDPGGNDRDSSLPSPGWSPTRRQRGSAGAKGRRVKQQDAHLYPELDQQHPLVFFCSLGTEKHQREISPAAWRCAEGREEPMPG